MSGFTAIGQRKPLVEGREKVTGTATYINDLNLPNMLHARFVTSLYAHAKVKSIDVEQAMQVSGVVSVLTSADLPSLVPSSRDRLLLARDKVIFAGQPVAIVLAESDAAATDAVEAVRVEYEPLQPVISIDDALDEQIPPIWPKGVPSGADDAAAHGADVGSSDGEGDHATNVVKTDSIKRGDVKSAWAGCDAVVEGSYSTPMVHQNSLETHGVIVQPDAVTGGATVWCSTQDTFGVRQTVGEMLGVHESDVRVIGTTVGGAFGAKFGLYEALVALVARQVKRPVKLILTRSEEFLATTPAPGIRVDARLGATRDGVLRALEADVFVDSGCYPMNIAGFIGHLLGSYYPLDHFHINLTEVMTNKPSAGAYRAPGAPTAVFVIDTLIEAVSRELSLDSIDVRLKNMAQPGDLRANDKPWPGMAGTRAGAKQGSWCRCSRWWLVWWDRASVSHMWP